MAEITLTLPVDDGGEDARAKFAAYRQEILERSGHQHALLALNLTTVAALAGFVLTDHADSRLLLLLPVLSGSIGLLWCDHAWSIESIGGHLEAELPWLASYEQSPGRVRRMRWPRVPLTFALVILFVAIPIAGLLIPIHHVHGALWVLWAAGLALVVCCGVFLLSWLVDGFRRARDATGPG